MKVLVVGYYGYGNFGDELILSALEDELSCIEGSRLSFLVRDPRRYAQRRRPAIDYVERSRPGAVLRALLDSDAIMLGGGGLIQDATSCHSALYYLSMPLVGHLVHKKTIAYAQGVGPLRHRLLRALTGAAFRRMALVDVRDEASRTVVAACGLDSTRIHVSGDVTLAYLCRIAERHGSTSGAGDTPIVVALNARFGWSAVRMAAALDAMSTTLQYPLALVVLFPAADLAYTREVRALLRQPSSIWETPGPEELVGLCRRAARCVAGRYHMALTALAAGTPTVALSYDPKMESLAHDFGFVAVPNGSDTQDLIRLVAECTPSSVGAAGIRSAASVGRTERLALLRQVLA